MRRAIFALLAATTVASSTGCGCLERLFCSPWGCCGGCGGCGCDTCGYEGDCGGCGGGCGCDGGYGGGYGGGGCGCDNGGMAHNGGYGGYAGYGMAHNGGSDHYGAVAYHGQRYHNPQAYAQRRRNSGGQRDYSAGPPTAEVSYPYYTNRGPRDFLARNPQSIGP